MASLQLLFKEDGHLLQAGDPEGWGLLMIIVIYYVLGPMLRALHGLS